MKTVAENIIWLKDLRDRFDKDVQQLMEHEPLWHRCRNCIDGYCCGHDIYPVTQSRLNPFRLEEWWLMLEHVKNNFNDEDRKRLTRNILSKRPDCIFLFGNRCSVHPARAWSCRVHPYTISLHPSPAYFPVGELALPSCPSLASAFGLKTNQLLVQKPKLGNRETDSRLVQAKLRKRKPVWLIDGSDYVREIEANAPRKDRPATDWEALLELAEEAAGKGGPLLKLYLEKMQSLKRLPDGRLSYYSAERA